MVIKWLLLVDGNEQWIEEKMGGKNLTRRCDQKDRWNGQLFCVISNTFDLTSCVSQYCSESFMQAFWTGIAPFFLPEGFSEAIAWMPTEIPSAFTHVQVSSGKFKLVKPSFTHLGRNQLFLWVQRSEKHFINLLQNSQWIQHSLPFLLSLFDSLCPSLLFQGTMSQHSSTGKYVLCSGRKLFTYEEPTRPPIGTRKKQGNMWNGSYGYWPCGSKHKRVLLT